PVRSTRCAFRHMPAGKLGFIENASVHGTGFRNLPAKPSECSIAGAVKKEMPRVEAGRNSCHAMRGKSEAAPTRFDFNTYSSKLLKIKKAASSYNAKSKLTRQAL
ncbi:MAG: hypothetical protein WCA96_05390, partial [Methylocella sp.]